MHIVKALVGGLIGGCIGAFLANMIQVPRGSFGPWLVLLAGLGAGIGARLACGANRNLVTGISAAIASVLSLVIVGYAMAAVAVQANADVDDPLPVAAEVESTIEDAAAELEEETTDEDPESPDAETESPDTATDGDVTPAPSSSAADRPPRENPNLPDAVLQGDSGASKQARNRVMELVANALSALVAFLLGTGSAAVATTTTTTTRDDSNEPDSAS